MAKDTTNPDDLADKKPVDVVSKVFNPVKVGKQKHLACADTVDPTDVIDRIEYQVSEDGGATWRTMAVATNAKAAPPPWDPAGPVQKPGMLVHLSMERTGAVFRTVASHRTGKPLAASAEEKA